MEPDSAYDSPGSWDVNMSSTSSSPRQSPVMPKSIQSVNSSIICSICKHTYSDPKVLPCFHTFCRKCLETQKPTVTCKLCNNDFILPQNGIQTLLPDYSMKTFINSLSNEKYNCDHCQNNARIFPAVAKCFDCNFFFCKHCLISHVVLNSGHRIMHIPTDFNPPKDNVEPCFSVNCIYHENKAVVYHCFSCNELLCNICIEQDHVGHRYEFVDTVKNLLMSALMNKMQENEIRLKELNLHLKCSQTRDAQLNAQYQEAQSRINETYNQFALFLRKCKQRQQENLDLCFNIVKGDLHNNFNMCQVAYEQTSRMSDFFFRLLKLGTQEEILMFKKLLEGKAEQLSLLKPSEHQPNLKFVSYISDVENFLYNAFGHVVQDDGINYEQQKPSSPLLFQELLSSPTSTPWKYDRWSSTCFDDLRMNLSTLSLSPESSSPTRSFQSLKSSVTRNILTYSWKFGAYGTQHGQFTEPNGVAINANGDIIVADTNNNRVEIFDSNGHFKHTFGCGLNDETEGTLLFPNRVAVTNTGDIVVTERAPTHQVQIYSQYGQFIRKFGANVLEHPRAVTVDKDGFIIVVECKVMRVVIFNNLGEVVQKFSCGGVLRFPNGVAVNDQRQIFISDNRNHCVVVYDYNGKKIRTIGNEGLTNFPIGVMLTKSGYVIVADNHNNFNLTVFTQEGTLISAIESKVKHAQCYDCAISPDGAVALTSKDYRVYIYKTNF